jgi:hypothetical protein
MTCGSFPTLLAALLAAGKLAEAGQVCRPTPDCFDGRCLGTPVEFLPVDLQLDSWTDGDYVRSNTSVRAHSLVQKDFGIFLHGPKLRPKQQKSGQYAPPLYVSGSLVDKVWRIDDIQMAPAGALAASMKFVSWASAPSTMWFVPPAYDGGPERFLVAEGNPFYLNPGNHTSEMWAGGVDLVDENKCTTLFPVNAVDRFAGKVVNTVECHSSGYCFFSVWKFYDDSLPSNDDCLYWCQTSSPDDPTSCTRSGILTDEGDNKICHVSGTGAVHGFMLGKTDVNNSNSFDMLLLYTGKGTFDAGESHMEMLKIVVSDDGAPKTVSRRAWGTDLTNKSITAGHDVGCDHAWTDDDGKYIWVGSFREKNDGVHMMDYDTGKLVHSIHGISSVITNSKYTYVSGIDGTGSWGKPGSVLAVATCQKYGTQVTGGESAVLLINISQDVTQTPMNAVAELIV